MAFQGHVTANVRSVPFTKKTSHISSSWFYDAATVKFLKSKYNDVLCGVVQWLEWEAKSETLSIPHDRLQVCLNDSSSRFVFQPVNLYTADQSESHANALFFDKVNRTAERFEPHNLDAYEMFTYFNLEKLDERLGEYLASIGYRYIAPTEFCPRLGPQYFEVKRMTGYCASWSLWYVDLRLSNPDVPRDRLVQLLLKKIEDLHAQGRLAEYMRRFVSQVYYVFTQEFPPELREYIIHYSKWESKKERGERMPNNWYKVNRMLEDMVNDPLFMNTEFRANTAPKKVKVKRRAPKS